MPLAGRVGVVTLSSRGGGPTLFSGEGPNVADDVPDDDEVSSMMRVWS